MSNESIKKIIEESLTKFEIGELNLNALKDSIELNGQALESMPYDLIKDIDEIEYQLTQCAFADEEDCQYDLATTISFIKNWLSKVPN